MTDQKVLVFGSFTEDEMKSLQRQAPENDSEIKFGSLDSATLRSVGIFNTKPIKLEESKARPSKLVNKENIVKILCATENTSYTVATIVHENGVVISGSRGSGVSNPSKWSSPKRHGVENMTIVSKPKEKEVLIDLSNAVDLVDFTENIHQAPNRLSATVWNLLPRGLVNLGNLCFLNATLQALLSCSPFVLLLQELRTRNIPKIGYPALGAFVEFISDFEVPTVSNSKKRISVLETGRPFRPIMFESILKIFSPDVPNSILGWPRQEDAQEFLSFILDQMHDELLKHEGQFPRENGSLVLSVNDEDDDETWETVGPRSKTAITRMQSFIPSKLSEIFGGQLRSVVKARGNKASATIQPYLLLHLNICPDPVSTIEDALNIFSAPETLEGYRPSAAGKDHHHGLHFRHKARPPFPAHPVRDLQSQVLQHHQEDQKHLHQRPTSWFLLSYNLDFVLKGGEDLCAQRPSLQHVGTVVELTLSEFIFNRGLNDKERLRERERERPRERDLEQREGETPS